VKYYELEHIEHTPGLRLVLTKGLPGPWGLAAKALFEIKGIDYITAAQHPGGDNSRLAALTGQTSAPVALYNKEKPAVLWSEILYLAERLNPEPGMIPGAMQQRALMFGLIHEIVGQNGFGWCRRLLMFEPMMRSPDPGAMMNELAGKYGYTEAAAGQASKRCLEIMDGLAVQLHQQHKLGSQYLVGDAVSAVDIYWAVFSSLLEPLPQILNPMPRGMRALYTAPPGIVEHMDTVLLDHRDMMYQHHLSLPLDYLCDDQQ
jgi:glutathione S-transferase